MCIRDRYNIKDIGSILCTGMVIKMLDDVMDNDCHYLKYLLKKHDKQTIYNTLLGYMLLLLCLGSILNYIYSSTLFVSAYVIGMFFDINMKMPSGLRVYQECIISVSYTHLSDEGKGRIEFVNRIGQCKKTDI